MTSSLPARWCSAALLLATLVGCATRPPAPQADPALWERHRLAAERMTRWELEGRIALHQNTQGWQANLQWLQRDDEFTIRLSGPLGQGGAYLEGDDTGVALTLSDRSTHRASDPETLMRQRMGWSVPVQGLRYWVRGLPVPHLAEMRRLDGQGRLSELTQNGWRILFTRYSAGTPALPTRLELTRGDLRVKLIVEQWKTTDPT